MAKSTRTHSASDVATGSRSEEPLSLLRGLLSRSFRWLIAAIWFLCRALLVAWATLAIYYSNLPSAGLRLALAAAFAAFAVWALLALAPTAYAPDRDRAVSRRGGLVDHHPSVAQSSLAAGSRGDAARIHRRRPRAPHRRPQLRIPHPERFHAALRRARGAAVAFDGTRFLRVLLHRRVRSDTRS